jgi:hypothetical protein
MNTTPPIRAPAAKLAMFLSRPPSKIINMRPMVKLLTKPLWNIGRNKGRRRTISRNLARLWRSSIRRILCSTILI